MARRIPFKSTHGGVARQPRRDGMVAVALLVFCFPSFALSVGAILLCCFAVAAGGVTMCCQVTVAMLGGQFVQSSDLLVQPGSSLKGGSGTTL